MSRWEQEEAEQEAAEQEAYEKQMQAMYDEQQRSQQCAEEDAWLRAEVERLKAENEVLRRERATVVAWLQRQSASLMSEDAGISAYVVRTIAGAIERGEHRREEER